VTARTDDNGNMTRYSYDELGRLVKETFADNTRNTFTYDADDNVIKIVDGNGSAVTGQYDGIDRVVQVDVARASAVLGTTQQRFEYDGLSRLTRASDNNDSADANDDSLVIRAYDSLGRLLEEVQNSRAISSQYDGDSSRRLGLVYPNGRALELAYDKLDRLDAITNKGSSSKLVDYAYIGPQRLLERGYRNGVRLTYLSDDRAKQIGYDGLNRIISHRHLGQGNSVIAGFEYAYDRASNKLFERKLHQQNALEAYSYDSFYRLTSVINAGQGLDSFQLDGVGNWASRNGVANKATTMNEYESFAGVPQQYDDNGNLTDDGRNRYEYDAFNRLVRVTRKSDNARIATYRYDVFNRRIGRVVSNSGALDDAVQYFYDGWQEIEELRPTSTQQYVYGLWIDELVTMDKDRDNDGKIDATYYYHEDGRRNIVAVSDAQGGAVERYAYDAYGKVSVTDAKGEALARTSVSNLYFFAGRRLDPETGLYYYRMRYMNPETGRFIQRDPIGMWKDRTNIGNAYGYVGNNPVNGTDPTGMETREECKRRVADECARNLKRNAIAGGISGGLGGAATGGLLGAIAGAIGGAVVGAFTAALECADTIEMADCDKLPTTKHITVGPRGQCLPLGVAKKPALGRAQGPRAGSRLDSRAQGPRAGSRLGSRAQGPRAGSRLGSRAQGPRAGSRLDSRAQGRRVAPTLRFGAMAAALASGNAVVLPNYRGKLPNKAMSPGEMPEGYMSPSDEEAEGYMSQSDEEADEE
jgi:RHS repeat-associated protein